MTELIWEGKYDKDGRKVAPLQIRLPFQTVETINESAQQRPRSLDLFSSGRPAEWRNRLIWGDKKYVLPALLEEFAGQINLIYIDPPFDTGQDFSFEVTVDGEEFTKEPSIIEQKAYRDTWGKGLDSYLAWFHEAASLLFDLLHDTGAMYVHLDWRLAHYIKVLLDDIFGMSEEVVVKACDFKRIGEFYKDRLKTIFSGVVKKPKVFYNSRGTALFQLFFAARNTKGAPIAIRIAEHLLREI